eukprot:CAMPEP_0184669776 /NCGR_PEP_ID=MMETSP0308-20130426/79009_1 /TAXON_ID=38269 /ORGANISM="Gloeochaete witrockiana, Strain SAG 46.84" /LENGTH=236 /DNA_ID=CAMNT_0027116207 /DNA_START=91 /DNA_END=798 /DNA_ORIENTATION=+
MDPFAALFRVAVAVIAVLAILPSVAHCGEPKDLAGILLRHQEIRAEVGSLPMEWDDTVAAHAQTWANYLRDSKNCGLMHGGMVNEGQNIAGGTTYLVNLNKSAELWYREKPKYCGQVVDYSNYLSFGHYSQQVWCSTTRLGCGIAYCNNNATAVVVCNYAPPGNYIGQVAFCPNSNGSRIQCPTPTFARSPTPTPSRRPTSSPSLLRTPTLTPSVTTAPSVTLTPSLTPTSLVIPP